MRKFVLTLALAALGVALFAQAARAAVESLNSLPLEKPLAPSGLLSKPYRPLVKSPHLPRGNNGVGNGVDPQPPGNPPINDGGGTGPGNPGNKGPHH